MARKALPLSQKARNAGISLVPSLTRSASRLAAMQGLSLSGLAQKLLLRELERTNKAAPEGRK